MSFVCKLDLVDGKEARFPPGEGIITHICCDCGLTHLIKVIPCRGGGFTMAFFRDNRSTGQRRRHMKLRAELAGKLRRAAQRSQL